MKPAVLVVNWNSGAHLRDLLASLIGVQSHLARVLVLDNGSGDESCQRLPQLENLELRLLRRNLGFAAAANAGIAALESEWVFLLNPDVQVHSGSLELLFQHAQTAPKCGIVFGPLLALEGGNWQFDFQCRELPTSWSLLSDAIFLDEVVSRRPTVQAEPPANPFDVEQPAAAYWLLRKQAWAEVGRFDDDFFPAWFEDVDLCRRLAQAGWKIRCFPDCPVSHAGGFSVPTLGRRQFTQIYYRNMLRYVRKHHAREFPFLWLPIQLGSWIRQRLLS